MDVREGLKNFRARSGSARPFTPKSLSESRSWRVSTASYTAVGFNLRGRTRGCSQVLECSSQTHHGRIGAQGFYDDAGLEGDA